MPASELTDLSRLCVHTVTTKPWSLEEAAENYGKAGVAGITVWRDALGDRDPAKAKQLFADNGLEAVSYCRGGFFPATTEADRRKAIDDNKKCLDEAAGIGAPLVVLVCGAVPGQPLPESRAQIRAGIEACVEHAKSVGVKLAIEPLHPMYADDRSAINTLGQANDMAEQIASEWVGIAADVYHLWWDPALEAEIKRCGKNGHLLAFHICDWKTPTTDLLLDRGLMGEGCIDIRTIRGWAEEAGFNGYNEVEVFSTAHWAKDQHTFLDEITAAYLAHS